MTTFFAVAFLNFLLGWYARRAYVDGQLLKRDDAPQLHGSDSLEEWKQVFRDTVIASEGQLSPAMERFLEGAPEPKALPAMSEKFAEVVRQRTQVREMKVRRRKLLGNALDEFDKDLTSSLWTDRVKVIRRWHKKGYKFSAQQRVWLFDHVLASDLDGLRKILDEQDGESEDSES